MWTADLEGHGPIELWYRSTLTASVLSGISAAVGLGLLGTSAVEFEPVLARRTRGWRSLFWTGVGLLPGYLVGQVLARTITRAQFENLVLPQPGESIEPKPWFAAIPPVFFVQAGTAAAVAGFVLVLLARWRLAEARREIAAAELDSGRWE